MTPSLDRAASGATAPPWPLLFSTAPGAGSGHVKTLLCTALATFRQA